MTSPPDPSTPRSPRPLRTKLLVGLGCLLALIATLAIGVGAVLALFGSSQLFVDACPAKRHLVGVEPHELVRVARALGTDPAREGVYWDSAAAPPRGRIERPANARDLTELPALIRGMAPLMAQVGGGGVKLTWDGPGYDYGYCLIVLEEGADEARMTRNNGSFHWSEKLQDGIWSFYAFH